MLRSRRLARRRAAAIGAAKNAIAIEIPPHAHRPGHPGRSMASIPDVSPRYKSQIPNHEAHPINVAATANTAPLRRSAAMVNSAAIRACVRIARSTGIAGGGMEPKPCAIAANDCSRAAHATHSCTCSRSSRSSAASSSPAELSASRTPISSQFFTTGPPCANVMRSAGEGLPAHAVPGSSPSRGARPLLPRSLPASFPPRT